MSVLEPLVVMRVVGRLILGRARGPDRRVAEFKIIPVVNRCSAVSWL
jgi:hypothetical protein